jgi:ferric reductase like protein
MIAAAVNAKVLWYLTRGSGIVALLLLTASVALGVVTSLRWKSDLWPRFTVASLHRSLTLLAIAFVAVHVGTTVLDGYAPVGLRDAFLPFLSHYRPVWLGLGAVAFDLLLALVITSLLRARIGYRMWRGIHWLAYASWPVALVHALGTGSDARLTWMVAVGIGAVAVAALAVVARAALGPGPRGMRSAAAAAALLAPVAIGGWYETGPARHGWARRAGTPTALLARPGTVQVAEKQDRRSIIPLPKSFTSRLHGTVHETGSDEELVTVEIVGRLSGVPGGSVRLVLRGIPEGGGVSMTASGVSYVPAGTRAVYMGKVTELDGQQVVAGVATPSGARLDLAFALNIDVADGTVTGTVRGITA